MASENSYTSDPGAGKFLAQLTEVYTDAGLRRSALEVDNSPVRPNDVSMPDLTRQQVTDLLAASEAKVDARLANFESTIKTGFSDAKAEMAGLRTDMHKMNADIKTWTLATMLTIIGTMLAAIFGVATIFNNVSKSSSPAAPPAPIVIYAQPAASPAPPTISAPQAAQKKN